MSDGVASVGARGEGISGPPWILGRRGSPLEAPENTIASLKRAIELGLDGVAYDVRRARSGELVLVADATLDRTSDGTGDVGASTIVELSGLDAGGWFDARFKGERIALADEALVLAGDPERDPPLHWLEIHERGVAEQVAEIVRELAPRASLRASSFSREVCLEARDAGLASVLCAHRASAGDQRFVHDERLEGYAVGGGGWRETGESEWKCERWSLAIDEPADLLEACRAGRNGFTTHEPGRALATRALVRLAPHDEGPYPVVVPELEVTPDAHAHAPAVARAAWFGSWSGEARVRNPFGFAVRCVCGIVPRRGAFDIDALPVTFDLGVSEERGVPYKLSGGATRPGGDPLFYASLRWRRGPGRPAGGLIFDAPLRRVRTAVADVIVRRLDLLKETRRAPDATMTLRRHRQHLLVSIESAGGLDDARTIVNLDGRYYYGGRGVRALLPPDFDARLAGIPFSCGLSGVDGDERVVRRWAGGIPDELDAGPPGRLVPLPTA